MASTAFSMPGPSAATKASARISFGKGEEDVGDAHQDRIGPAAGIASDRADQQADRGGDDGDENDDVERPVASRR